MLNKIVTIRPLCIALVLLSVVSVSHSEASVECVVVLHGLARTSGAMQRLGSALQREGYAVVNVDYPSRKKPIEELAPLAVKTQGIEQCPSGSSLHFVTHSMGGILVRYYLQNNEVASVGRVVMLAPPNQGSQVVDKLRNTPGYKLFNGPAGMQLGTDDDSVPSQLGPVEFELGVIAGSRTFNPVLSQFLPNPDDGKVSVENTKVEGMTDHITLPVTHTFMMRSGKVIEQVLHFIRHGEFQRN